MRTREVLIFVRRAGEVLVLHRSERQGGYWHAVAGGVEDDEPWAEAAARELREETGLVAEPRDLRRPYVYEDAAAVTVQVFVAEAPGGWEPELDWEHDGYRWCSVDEAVLLLHWPEPRALVRAL